MHPGLEPGNLVILTGTHGDDTYEVVSLEPGGENTHALTVQPLPEYQPPTTTRPAPELCPNCKGPVTVISDTEWDCAERCYDRDPAAFEDSVRWWESQPY